MAEDPFVHDPSMIREDQTYYVFSTGRPQVNDGGIQVIASEDLRTWRSLGTAFPEIPAWARERVPGVRSLWAPDISLHQGRYRLYYAGSTFGRNTSVIGLACNSTLDPDSPSYRWVDRGLVLASTQADDWNAIDPHLLADEGGAAWLSYGSFWSGIHLVRLDAATGLPDGSRPQALARRPEPPHAMEAPCVLHRPPHYYLFVSFDFCCRGVNSTYRIVSGRAAHPAGPYRDEDGRPMLEGGGTPVLGTAGTTIGPGGQSVYRDGDTEYLVYHFYDGLDGGRAKLQIRALLWTDEGWPRVGPPIVPHASRA